MAAERFAATLDEQYPWALLSGDDYAIRRYGRTWVFICVWHRILLNGKKTHPRPSL